MNITVTISAPELANAIQSLAQALINNPVISTATESIPATPAPSVAPPVGVPVQQPLQGAQQQYVPPTPTNYQQPQQQTQPGQQSFNISPGTAVPTTTQTYTMDQLAVAATQLNDAGRRAELVSLLSSFGIQALTALPQEQYGAFATKLREMGAKI
ncbi:hypothetical protein B9C88_09775 [Brevibacillus laterosporus]|uniref:hypothetical protein n=1 Tax=Brevibacillus laterosporus TaxID=1465 RepID=UPI000BCAF433|nr:hypothetical protein [Brevibacillus laterosporus]PCN44493.1 hypothetical protein B9C88_09775 [Brevibacillus laterosporus]